MYQNVDEFEWICVENQWWACVGHKEMCIP